MVNLQNLDTGLPALNLILAKQGPLAFQDIEFILTHAAYSPHINEQLPLTVPHDVPAGVEGVGKYRFVNRRNFTDQNQYRPIVNLYGAAATTSPLRRLPTFYPSPRRVICGSICQLELPNGGGFLIREIYKKKPVPTDAFENEATGDIN